MRSQSLTGRLGLAGKAVFGTGSAAWEAQEWASLPPAPSSLSLGMCRHAAFKRALQELITANPRSQLFSHPRVRLHRGVFIIGMSFIKARAS